MELQTKPTCMDDGVWIWKNKMACAVIRSCLTRDIKYHVMTETSAKNLWKILESKYLAKSIESRLHLKRSLYHFQVMQGTFISNNLNAYTKLLTNLASVEVVIEEKDKILILPSSLPDVKYETFH